MKVTVATRPSPHDEYDLIVDVTVTRRRPGRLPPSIKVVSVGVAQGAGFVYGNVVGGGLNSFEATSLRSALARAVCAQLYLGDFAGYTCDEIPALTAAETRRLMAALENIRAFLRAFAGVPLPRRWSRASR